MGRPGDDVCEVDTMVERLPVVERESVGVERRLRERPIEGLTEGVGEGDVHVVRVWVTVREAVTLKKEGVGVPVPPPSSILEGVENGEKEEIWDTEALGVPENVSKREWVRNGEVEEVRVALLSEETEEETHSEGVCVRVGVKVREVEGDLEIDGLGVPLREARVDKLLEVLIVFVGEWEGEGV